jgi:hypothetical protein
MLDMGKYAPKKDKKQGHTGPTGMAERHHAHDRCRSPAMTHHSHIDISKTLTFQEIIGQPMQICRIINWSDDDLIAWAEEGPK